VRPIEYVLRALSPEWLSVDGVVGAAIGSRDGEKVIVVYVTERSRDIESAIPESAEGYRVVVEESGRIEAIGSE